MERRAFIKTAAVLATAPLADNCSGSGIDVIESLPVSPFDEHATAEQVTAGLDLSGRIIVVTGCNSGIGLETMRVLAMRGAHVIGTGRTLDKAARACAGVTGATTPVMLELADFNSAVDCAELIGNMVPHVDAVIGNAGMIAGPELEQVNGVEKTFAVNHLGHFIFVNRLLKRVRAAEQGRVVMVSSSAAFRAEGIEFDNLSGERGYNSMRCYGQSKLANALFSLELAGRLSTTNATANALHPGVIKTHIARNQPWYIRTLFDAFGGLFTRSMAQGAATSCYLASSPRLAAVNGSFFVDCNPIKLSGSNHLYDKDMAAKLWAVSAQLTAKYLARDA